MMGQHKHNFIKSVSHAINGARRVFATERSFRIQLIIGLVALAFSAVFALPLWQYVVIILLVGLVLILELMNSIIERILDSFKPRIHPVVGEIKDIMAAAVLIASIVAAVIGLIIFIPYFVETYYFLFPIIVREM